MLFKAKNVKTVIISRPDSIGDAVLAFPVAKALKDHFPDIRIGFLGKHYVKDLVSACKNIDEFIDLNYFFKKEVSVCGMKPEAILHLLPYAPVAKRAKELGIPIRIGTTHRLYHWHTCNRMVISGRKNSNLHEAQLNLKLLSALGIRRTFSLEDIYNAYELTGVQPLVPEFSSLPDIDKYNIILHPKSQGNAVEWGIENFISLIRLLNPQHYRIFISGIETDRKYIGRLFNEVGENVIDLTGKLSLAQFVSFIKQCNGLIACSTGPVHLAAALGIDTYGLYSVHRPIFAKRWGPVGKHTFVLESQSIKRAPDMNDITPESMAGIIERNRQKMCRFSLPDPASAPICENTIN